MRQFSLILMITISMISSIRGQEQEKMLFLGASIVAGYGLPAEQRITGLLEKKAKVEGVKIDFRSEAVAGASTKNGISQLDRALSADFVPDHLFIGLGISDAVYNIGPEQIKSNLKRLIDHVRSVNHDVKIYLFQGKIFQRHVTSRVAAKGSAYEKSYEMVFQEIAQDENVKLLPFMLESIEGEMQYFQSDRLHPNARGVEKISDQIWQVISSNF